MVNQIYPRLEIDLNKLRENVAAVVALAGKYNIDLVGVVKGVGGHLGCADAFVEGGVKYIASSRLNQIEAMIEHGITLPTVLLRIPMISEVPEVIRLCDTSLNSEVATLLALNEEAKKAGKIHNVILMSDIGDLREGFWQIEEAVATAKMVEKELTSLHLIGVGTNVGCYGSVDATKDTLNKLVLIAEEIESVIGRKLEYISGGATSSIKRLIDGDIPEKINHLRIGEGIILARDLDVYYNYDMSFLNQDVFTLKAEVIEVKDKPTHPVGTIAVDAFGKRPEYVDRGIRKRAIIGIGKVDYGSSIEEIFPRTEGVEIIGASSDHTILDVEDCSKEIKVGDVLEFDINYGSMVYLTNCPNVQLVTV